MSLKKVGKEEEYSNALDALAKKVSLIRL